MSKSYNTVRLRPESYNTVCPRPKSCDTPRGFNACHSKSLLWRDKNRGTYTRLTFPTQGSNQVSHIAGGFFASWATREAQEYWNGEPIPSPADLPDPGIKPGSPALQADSLPTELWGKPTDTGGQPEIQQKLRIFGLLPNTWFCFCIFPHFASNKKYSI